MESLRWLGDSPLICDAPWPRSMRDYEDTETMVLLWLRVLRRQAERVTREQEQAERETAEMGGNYPLCPI